MPTKQPILEPIELRDVATLLIKHYGLHEGLYTVSFEFQISVGNVGRVPEEAFPGASVAIRRVGLVEAKESESGSNAVDAATVNPKKSAKKK